MNSIHIAELDRQLLNQLKENLLDYDILVDDARRELEAALERYQGALRRRDATAAQLQALIARLAPAA